MLHTARVQDVIQLSWTGACGWHIRQLTHFMKHLQQQLATEIALSLATKASKETTGQHAPLSSRLAHLSITKVVRRIHLQHGLTRLSIAQASVQIVLQKGPGVLIGKLLVLVRMHSASVVVHTERHKGVFGLTPASSTNSHIKGNLHMNVGAVCPPARYRIQRKTKVVSAPHLFGSLCMTQKRHKHMRVCNGNRLIFHFFPPASLTPLPSLFFFFEKTRLYECTNAVKKYNAKKIQDKIV